MYEHTGCSHSYENFIRCTRANKKNVLGRKSLAAPEVRHADEFWLVYSPAKMPIQLGEMGGAIAERPVRGYSKAKSKSRRPQLARTMTWGGVLMKSTSLIRSPTTLWGSSSFKKKDDGDSPKKTVAELLAARRLTKPWYIIDPRRSKVMPFWDVLTTVCLLLTALITPFEVAFLSMPPTWTAAWVDPLFLVNRLVDLTFFIDLFLNFFLMYQDLNSVDGVKWIDEPAAIVQNYLRGWFSLDLFSILPSTFDLLPYGLDSGLSGSDGVGAEAGAVTTDGDILARFKFLRVLRCFRLIKLVRLMRTSRMVARWETRVSFNYAFLSICKVLVAYLLVAHWSACLLVLPTTFYDNPASTWLGAFGYCVAESTAADAHGGREVGVFPPTSYPRDDDCYQAINLARGLHADNEYAIGLIIDGTCRVRCETPGALFVGAIFLTLQVICGATGGVLDRAAFNVQEQVVFCLVAAVGALLWGQVIGTFVSVIANANSEVQWFRLNMDRLNEFVRVYELPDEMRRRLREYFHQSRHVHRGQRRKGVLAHMSPQLQGEVALTINRRWISGIRFLQGAETELVIQVACSLQPAVFTPGEQATPGHLYVIHKGVSLYCGRLLTSGRSWGQDMILARQHLCHVSARAMSYLEVYRISRSGLLELARPFPQGFRKIRWEALRLAMMRTLILTKRELQQREKSRNGRASKGERVVRVLDVAEADAKQQAADANVQLAAATEENGEEVTADSPAAAFGETIWETFLQKASGKALDATEDDTSFIQKSFKEKGDEEKVRAPSSLESLSADPKAVMEVPTLQDVSGKLAGMHEEMAELKNGIGLILRHLGSDGKGDVGSLAPSAAGQKKQASPWGAPSHAPHWLAA